MSLHLGHRARTPALVRGCEACGAADRKGRNDLEAECARVIVVNEQDHVGGVGSHPPPGEFVALEDRRPVRLVELAEIERGADRRDVRGRNACGDARHQPAFGERPPLSIIRAYSSWLMPVIEAAAY